MNSEQFRTNLLKGFGKFQCFEISFSASRIVRLARVAKKRVKHLKKRSKQFRSKKNWSKLEACFFTETPANEEDDVKANARRNGSSDRNGPRGNYPVFALVRTVEIILNFFSFRFISYSKK